MPAQIGQRIFASGPQTYLALKRDEYIRQLAIGNNWQRIRIGALIAIGSSSAIVGLDFTVGVCTYPYGPLAWNCSNYVGMGGTSWDGSTAVTYTAGAAPYMLLFQVPRTRVGIVSATTGGSGNYYVATNTGTPQRRSIWIVDITKGSPNYTVTGSGSFSAAQAQLDYSYANLLEAVSQPLSPPAVAGVALTVGVSSTTLAASETPGILDAACVTWNKIENPLEIYGLAVFKVY